MSTSSSLPSNDQDPHDNLKTQSRATTPLTLIVATTSALGIGFHGKLSWHIKTDLKYFARVTTRVPPPLQSPEYKVQNAVIMGRNTWESIPEKFRPLKGRVNVVLSTREFAGDKNGEGFLWDAKTSVMWAGSLGKALEAIEGVNRGRVPLSSRGVGEEIGEQVDPKVRIGRVFVIGGARVYRDALERKEMRNVLVTRVGGEWECDVHFPVALDTADGWRRVGEEEFEEWVGEEVPKGVVKEGGVEFEFRMYERV